MHSEIRAYINVIALCAVLFFNYLANALPLNNLTQAEISYEIFPVLFTPAPYVFSIWGLIYFLLVGFVIYQALPKYRANPYNNAVGIFFTGTALLNIFWLLAWHYLQVTLSLALMVLLLLTLVAIYLRISGEDSRENICDRVFIKFLFSLYLSWICVALLANFNVILYDIGWLGFGFGSTLFTVLIIIMGALAALYIFLAWQDYVFPLVFAWSFIGIAVRHGGDLLLLTIVASVSAAALLFFVVWVSKKRGLWSFKFY